MKSKPSYVFLLILPRRSALIYQKHPDLLPIIILPEAAQTRRVSPLLSSRLGKLGTSQVWEGI